MSDFEVGVDWSKVQPPAEDLIQQIESLKKQIGSYHIVVSSQASQISVLTKKLNELKNADQTLDSELTVNDRLTQELSKANELTESLTKQLKETQIKLAASQANDLSSDTSALNELIAKAGEVMRKQCYDVTRRPVNWLHPIAQTFSVEVQKSIGKLPGITLEDLR